MPSKRHKRRWAVGLVATFALVVPTGAAADDQSVYNTFHFSHPRFQKLRDDFERGERHWEDSGYRDPDDANRACRRTAALALKVKSKMQGKHTSSTTGTKARSRAVSGIEYRKRWADAERLAIESFMNFDGAGYLRRHRKAKEYIARAQRYEEQAQKLFKQAGVNTNP